jgi:hypothetical protein
MKTPFSWKSLTVALTLAFVLTAPVFAQPSTIRVNVPFAFNAGSQSLPAGVYRVTVDSEHMLSYIAAADNTARFVVRLLPGGPNRDPVKIEQGLLRFEKNGARYVMIGIWRPGFTEGYRIARPRPLTELAGPAPVLDVSGSR